MSRGRVEEPRVIYNTLIQVSPYPDDIGVDLLIEKLREYGSAELLVSFHAEAVDGWEMRGLIDEVKQMLSADFGIFIEPDRKDLDATPRKRSTDGR